MRHGGEALGRARYMCPQANRHFPLFITCSSMLVCVCVHMFRHTCICACMHAGGGPIGRSVGRVGRHASMHAGRHTNMQTCGHTQVHMRMLRLHAFVCVCVAVHTCVRLSVHARISKSTWQHILRCTLTGAIAVVCACMRAWVRMCACAHALACVSMHDLKTTARIGCQPRLRSSAKFGPIVLGHCRCCKTLVC